MLAAESAFEALTKSTGDAPVLLSDYPDKVKNSWVWSELYEVRNFRPVHQWGTIPGILYNALDSFILKGSDFPFLISRTDSMDLPPQACRSSTH